jgi:hypothetical protein
VASGLGVFFQFFVADRTFAFFRAQLHFGNQAAEILIAGARGDQEGKTEGMVDCFVISSQAGNFYTFESMLGVEIPSTSLRASLRLHPCFTS